VLKIALTNVLLCLCMVSLSPLAAEQSGRECIGFATPGQGYRIQPGSGWQTLAHLKFSFNSNSDIIAQASAMFSESNTPDVLVSYQIWLDGAATSWTIDRLPGTFPGTHVVRSFIPDVTAGVHTLSLKVQNLGSVPVDYNGFWIGPTMVDASESTTIDQTAAPITIDTNWTTLAQASLAVSSSQMIMMQGYAEQHTGVAGRRIEYRFQAGTTTLQTYTDALAGQLPDGQIVTYIYAAPPSGTNTIQLQAHTISGTAQIQSRHLWMQTMPRYTVLDGTFTATSIPNNGTYTALATSPAVGLNSLSLSGLSAAGSRKYTTPVGYGLITYGAGTGTSEVQLRMEFLENGNSLGFDIGQLDQPYWGALKLQALMSNGDGKLGFLPPPTTYSVLFSALGLCPGQPAVPVQAGGRFQVAISPDNFPYLDIHCDQHPELQCCASFPQQCTYECAADQPTVASVQRGCYG
jgi:hypothetical protein